DPLAAVAFLRKLRAASAGGDPVQALPRAIKRVRDMRLEVAAEATVRPSIMAALSGAGVRVATVAGIPVGPLPTESAAANVSVNALNYMTLDPEKIKRLESVARPLTVPLASRITPGGWVWLGPGNIGGRTRSLLIHPTDPKTMWVAGVSGGIWR